MNKLKAKMRIRKRRKGLMRARQREMKSHKMYKIKKMNQVRKKTRKS
jgi:hypothetical protein